MKEEIIKVIAAVLILVETYYFAFRRGYDKGYIAGLDYCINFLEKLKGENDATND